MECLAAGQAALRDSAPPAATRAASSAGEFVYATGAAPASAAYATALSTNN
jgi:hypothetical protein